jgi:pimeloyl-ACP methyl ester carboxylesterase
VAGVAQLRVDGAKRLGRQRDVSVMRVTAMAAVAGSSSLREALPEEETMTTTNPPPAEGTVRGSRHISHAADSPPGYGTRPFPAVPGVTHRFIDVRGAGLHVAEAGDGEPVVLLHGFPQHWYAWRHVVPLLAGQHRLICPDWRGFGWSQAPPRGYATADRAADILALLDALGLGRVRLIAHDWGGHAAFMAALEAPERVSHLLAVNAAHPWLAQRRLLPQLWRFWHTAFFEYPGIGRLVLRHWPGLTRFLLRRGAADPAAWQPGEVEEFIAASRQPGSAQAGEALHWQFVLHDIPGIILHRYRSMRLTVPAVIMTGAQDWMLPPKLLAGADRHADDLRLQVVSGAGHFLPVERPAEVAEAARELFRRS